MTTRTIRTAALAGALTLALAGPAAAHITADPGEAPADSYATLDFGVGHGCEDSPTTRVRIQIPPSVPSVTPRRSPFWDISTKEGRKDPVELHGEEITRGTSEVAFTAKQPLDPHQLDVLTLSVKLPAGNAGDTVHFPAIQECAKGQTRWIQIPAEGESEEDLESPAPAVVLTAAGGGDEPVSSDAAPASDGGAPIWLAVVALVIGALGLFAGIGALLAARRAEPRVSQATKSLALSAKTKPGKEEGQGQCFARPCPDDAAGRRFAARISASDGTRTRDLRRDRPAL